MHKSSMIGGTQSAPTCRRSATPLPTPPAQEQAVPLKPHYDHRLRASYARFGKGLGWPPRRVRLPSSLDLSACPLHGGVRINLSEAAVLANMQNDTAAFEGWALALLLWCGEKAITLDWTEPTTDSGHYQRFLYRVDRFRSLLPEMIFLADGAKLSRSRVQHFKGDLLINQPSRSRAVSEERVASLPPEAQLEARLVADPAFSRRYGLTAVDRQFPVGLYEGAVARDHAVFTGGKSAIDIVGTSESGFWLFELKAGDNAPIGGLTELLFYTSLVRDAAGVTPRFQFAGGASCTTISGADVRNAAAINAVLLVEASHPLLDHPELPALLNAAAAATWNQETGAVPVRFYLERVS